MHYLADHAGFHLISLYGSRARPVSLNNPSGAMRLGMSEPMALAAVVGDMTLGRPPAKHVARHRYTEDFIHAAD